MSEERQWYPADWVDETCPPAKSAPENFIIADAAMPTGYRLGYEDDDDGLFGDEREVFSEVLAIGDIVTFMCCDSFDDIDLVIYRDGACQARGSIPRGHNWVTIHGDMDTLRDSFDETLTAIRDPASDLHAYVFDEDPADPQTITLSFARWSDRLPHQFVIEDGKPMFRQVSAAKASN